MRLFKVLLKLADIFSLRTTFTIFKLGSVVTTDDNLVPASLKKDSSAFLQLGSDTSVAFPAHKSFFFFLQISIDVLSFKIGRIRL